jgi:hypothetical protein
MVKQQGRRLLVDCAHGRICCRGFPSFRFPSFLPLIVYDLVYSSADTGNRCQKILDRHLVGRLSLLSLARASYSTSREKRVERLPVDCFSASAGGKVQVDGKQINNDDGGAGLDWFTWWNGFAVFLRDWCNSVRIDDACMHCTY